MKTSVNHRWFERCGLASLDDLDDEEWAALFEMIERDQSNFLSAEEKFHSPEYKWPADALHNCFRIWEYPYVLANLKKWLAQLNVDTVPKVLDFGSGVTFFPFSLAKEGFDVIAMDIDPVVESGFQKAIEVTPCYPGRVDFLMSTENSIPIADSTFDAIYSISVLEHTLYPFEIVAELERVLAPFGLLILTFDLCLQGEAQFTPDVYRELRDYLSQNFLYVCPEITIHPARVLDCRNSIYPYELERKIIESFIVWGKNCIKRMLGRPLHQAKNCACAGFVLQKCKPK